MRLLFKGMVAAAIILVLLLNCAPTSMASEGLGGGVDTGGRVRRAVERPDHDGPDIVGYMYESFAGTTKSYSVSIKIFYPAQSAGENTTVDSAGAPYPTVVMLTGFGGGLESLNNVATRITTWGMVAVGLEVNWNDWPNCANVSDMNDLLTQLENDNVTTGHRAKGIMDINCFGLFGYSSGGGLTVVDSAGVARIKAAVAWAPAIGNDFSAILATSYTKPIQVQGGSADPDYDEHADYIYKNFKLAPRHHIQINGGNHGGPYSWDGVISHFLRYLRNITAYEEFLYWGGAMNDAANTTYAINFTLANGTYFPPNMTASASNTTPAEDTKVDFTLSIEGYLPLGHARGTFVWDTDSDGTVDDTGPSCMTASRIFNVSGTRYVRVWYQLGDLAINTNRTLSVKVTNLPPTASLDGNRTGVEDELLQFAGTAQDTVGDMAGLQYEWDFGDGSGTPFGKNLSSAHSYSKAGRYNVTFSAMDNDGVKASAALTVDISNVAPQATAGPDVSATEDEVVTFSGEGNDTLSDNQGLEYRWAFGDGAVRDWDKAPAATHSYARSENYTANLTARDGDGAMGSSTLRVRVHNVAPSCQATEPKQGTATGKDEELQFDGTGTDTLSDIASLRFRWDFGDGNSSQWSADARATHTYTKGGSFRPILTVRDDDGALSESDISITIRNQAPTVRITAPQATAASEDEKVLFTAVGDDTESDTGTLEYSWLIDGKTCTGPSIELSFDTQGPRAFNVTVTDREGAKGTDSGLLTVNNIAPKLKADISPATIFSGDSINFSTTVTDSASDRASLKVTWNFGDNTTSANLSGTHIYAKAGTYTVTVSVEDDEGEGALDSITVTVSARPGPPPPPPVYDDNKPSSGPSAAVIAGGAAAAIAVVGVLAFLLMRRRVPGKGDTKRIDELPVEKEAREKNEGD